MDWLSSHASGASLEDLLLGTSAADLQVALTFDDGYETLRRVAAPILRDVGLVATVYVNSSWIGDGDRIASESQKGHYPGEQFLRWDEVIGLRELGWTIGSHAADHVDLTQQPDADLRSQLERSKAAIESRLGIECRHLAYPWGRNDRRVRQAVASAGYQWAVSAIHGPVPASADRYAVPRIDIRKDYELEDFIAVVRGDWDFLRTVQLTRRLLT